MAVDSQEPESEKDVSYRPKEKPVPPGYMAAFARFAGKRGPGTHYPTTEETHMVTFDGAVTTYARAAVEGNWENDTADIENSERLRAGEWLLKNANDDPLAIVSPSGQIQTEFFGGQPQQPRGRHF